MRRFILGVATALVLTATMFGCADQIQQDHEDTAVGAVHQATAKVATNLATGLTVEQENIKRRLENDNKPGSIKYLYLISPFTGDVISYSSVKGKVTSSGKRLKPKELVNTYEVEYSKNGVYLTEQMGDDGAYGSSAEYLYWWDLRGVYRQVAPGACSVLITDQPIRVKKGTLRLDSSSGE